MRKCLAMIAAMLVSSLLYAAAVNYSALESPLSSAAYSWRLLSHETDLVRKLRGYLTKFSRKS